jgi:hypothetical protein
MAIAAFEDANDVHPQHPYCIDSISKSYNLRFEQTKDYSDLDLAICAGEQEFRIDSGACGQFRQVDFLAQLLLRRFSASHSHADLDKAIQLYRTVMFCGWYHGERFRGAACYADLCMRYMGAVKSLRPYQIVIDLIQEMISPSYPITEQYGTVTQVRDAHNAAVAAAIDAGDFALALTWFERGRCIVWGHVFRMRIPVEDLRPVATHLADDIREIYEQISDTEAMLERSHETPGQLQASYRYPKLIERLNSLILKVRSLPGHEGFLQPKTLDELRETASLGPVVAIHVDKSSCSALILQHSRDDVLCIPLPQLTLNAAERMRNRIQHSLIMGGVRGMCTSGAQHDRSSMAPALSALWARVVEPVLRTLGYTSPGSSSELPRITWCASGPLASLPLHAAGLYGTDSEARAFNCAIHSYTPSLSALLSALLQSRLAASPSKGTVFAISQPETPDQSPLPGTLAEVKAIQRVVGADNLTWLDGAAATSAAVLAQIGQHAWTHLACHAVQDQEKPMESGFLLCDGRVSLRALMRRTGAGRNSLAVLSACQTATGDGALPEEAMHLAAGMLMTGFRSVVGTMWSIGDGDAPVVMDAFYTYLVDEARGDSARSAVALHEAVGRLREKVGEDRFLQWVPFVHFGV